MMLLFNLDSLKAISFYAYIRAELFLDEVWNVSLDRMRNYKSYFCLDNSSNLK